MLVLLSCTNKNTPEYAAKQYLTALKNKDWETAKKYSSDDVDYMLDLMKADGSDFRITEIKDIKCRPSDGLNCYICTFCCTQDSAFQYIFLDKSKEGNWQSCHRKHIPEFIH